MIESIYQKLNDKKWLEQQYVTNRKTAVAIANELDVHYTTVRRAIKRLGLKDAGKKRFPELYDKKWVQEQLKTKSLKQIADELGSTVGHIGYRVHKLGINLGTNKSESIKASLKKKFPEGRFGEQASNWRGGMRSVNKYIAVYSPDHPRADSTKRVFEHIIVAEQKLGRYVTQDEVVHHINGNRHDNRPENLEVIKRRDHVHQHFTSGKGIQSLIERIKYLERILDDHEIKY